MLGILTFSLFVYLHNYDDMVCWGNVKWLF